MNYLRLAIAILLLAFAQCSYADSILTLHITEATMFMGPNDGSGDNIGFTFTGPGIKIFGTAGMGCFDWCTGQPVPDTNVFPSEIFLSGFPDVLFHGVSAFLDPQTSFFNDSGGLNPTETGHLNGVPFVLTLPTNGSWDFIFQPTTDQNGNPAFSFVSGSFSASAPAPVPEPGTIGLMLTGLAGIGGILRRKGTFHR